MLAATEHRRMDYREATASDAHGIARLHAESWRRNYRGAFSDAFLDGPVVDDRTAVWTDRLSRSRSDQHTVIADADGRVAEFAHVIFDADLTWGSLLDNLHVDHVYNRQGVGAALMAEMSGVCGAARRRPGSSYGSLSKPGRSGLLPGSRRHLR
jgi:predicted N-acetyltransferase YhbS